VPDIRPIVVLHHIEPPDYSARVCVMLAGSQLVFTLLVSELGHGRCWHRMVLLLGDFHRSCCAPLMGTQSAGGVRWPIRGASPMVWPWLTDRAER
jgi:hypothetical protein